MGNKRPGVNDPGAIDAVSGKDRIATIEHNINKQNSALYCAQLKAKGAVPVQITGPLGSRADRAKTAGVKSLISWHCNASTNANAKGFELFVSGKNTPSYKLAQEIEKRLEASKLLERYGTKYRGITSNGSLYIVREPARLGIDAVLIEDLFVTNIDDEEILHTQGYAAELTAIVCDAVLDHYGEAPKKKGKLFYVTWPSSKANQTKVIMAINAELQRLGFPMYDIHKLANGNLQVIANEKSRLNLEQASKNTYKSIVLEKE
jgi:hypothetical protein